MTQVVELYTFRTRTLGAHVPVTLGRFTSAVMPASDGTNTWTPIAGLSREKIQDAQSKSKNEISLVIPADNEIAQRFLPEFADTIVSPEQPLKVLIERAPVSSIDDTTINFTFGANSPIYAGTASGAKFSGSMCELMFEGMRKRLESRGPTQRFQRQCRWDLYGDGCGVNKATYLHNDTIVGFSGSPKAIELAGIGTAAANFFAGGHAVYKQVSRLVLSNNTTTAPAGVIVLASAFPFDVAPTDAIEVYAGCNHSEDHCLNKFSNLENFGGFSRVAHDNPFRRGIPGSGVS